MQPRTIRAERDQIASGRSVSFHMRAILAHPLTQVVLTLSHTFLLALRLRYWLGSGKRRQRRDHSFGRHSEDRTRGVAHDALNLFTQRPGPPQQESLDTRAYDRHGRLRAARTTDDLSPSPAF